MRERQLAVVACAARPLADPLVRRPRCRLATNAALPSRRLAPRSLAEGATGTSVGGPCPDARVPPGEAVVSTPVAEKAALSSNSSADVSSVEALLSKPVVKIA
jgi:hypothetical protein